jgi:dihydrolipoamide dehydrogenase
MTETTHDVVIIGGGPGGYVAALRAAQLGLRTACVEMRENLGGTCLNVGCIPSKALLHSSERYAEAKSHLAEHGIQLGAVELDLATMMSRKEKVVADLAKGIAFLLDKNEVEHVRGTAAVSAPGQVDVTLAAGGTQTRAAPNVVIATGSESTPLAGLEIDEKRILSSTGALSLERVPERLVVVGGGAIGLELASVWSRLGSQVTVVEFLAGILPGMDSEIAKQAQRVLKRQGLEFKLSSKVAEARLGENGRDVVALRIEPAAGGDAAEIEAEAVLVCIGRRPYTEGLGLAEVGVAIDDSGFVQVNERFETSVPGIFAIGDCVPGPMLAHKAEEDGVACVEGIAGGVGHAAHVNYALVPAVVYTWPEVAAVGMTEEQLREASVEYRVGKFPFSANSRARATGETDGLVKILADARTDRVLGVHILGPLAGDLLQEAVIAMGFGASSEDIARTCHAHPAMGEALREAALAIDGRALHT